MAARSFWKGFLRLSLVAVPVKAYPASVSGGGDIHLHQLHPSDRPLRVEALLGDLSPKPSTK